MDKIELKPCPFCGNSSRVRLIPWDGDGEAGFYVVCDASGAYRVTADFMPVSDSTKGCGCSGAWGEDEAEAAAAWNRRAAPQGEPVAWMHPQARWAHKDRAEIALHIFAGQGDPIPLYLAPPSPSLPEGLVAVPDVDALAQEIRRVDGNNDLGAGALAEAILAFLLSAAPAVPGVTRDDGTLK